jgi:hypothetical protein
MIDAADLALIEDAAANHGQAIDVVVNACAYSCCGKGWRRREGYEQHYRGWIDNYEPAENGSVMTFMLYSTGLGTISYVCAIRADEVTGVFPVGSDLRGGGAR